MFIGRRNREQVVSVVIDSDLFPSSIIGQHEKIEVGNQIEVIS